MRRCHFLLCFLAFLLSSAAPGWGQVSRPYALWEDPQSNLYTIGRVDPATGNLQAINTLPGMTGLVVPNTVVHRPTQQQLIYLAQYGPQTVLNITNTATGANTNQNFGSNAVGLRYHCIQDSIYCLMESNDDYYLCRLLPDQFSLDTIAQIPGVSGTVGENFALNPDSNRYAFVALVGASILLFETDLSTGSIVHSQPFPYNTQGLFYNCNLGSYQALLEQNNQYYLVTVHPASGTVSQPLLLSGITPGFIAESATFNPTSDQFTFRGFVGNTPTVIAANPNTGAITASAPLSGNAAGLTDSICCQCAAPVPDFSVLVNGQVATFTDQSQPAPWAWYWDFGDGFNDQVQHPQHAYGTGGQYVVSLTVGNACGSSTYQDTIQIAPVGIEVLASPEIEIFPVPVRDRVHLRLPEGLTAARLRVLDQQGRTLALHELQTQEPIVDMSGWAKGLYLMVVDLQDGRRMSRQVLLR